MGPRERVHPRTSYLADQFEQVLELITEIRWDTIRDAATETERRTLLDEFGPTLNVCGDHLQVEV